MRYLLLLCSLVLITQVSKAGSRKQSPAALVKVSKRNDYIYTVGKTCVDIPQQQSQEQSSLSFKGPFKKYLGDNAQPAYTPYIIDYQYKQDQKKYSIYLSDHPLQYFFLLFPQHYFW